METVFYCRVSNQTKKWVKIWASSPEEAAVLYPNYADYLREWPAVVTVMNHGRYRVVDKSTYSPVWVAEKCNGGE